MGTVLVKSFLFAGKLIETRLFVRFADMWAGYSYEWNDAQTDANLVVEDGLTKNIVNGSGRCKAGTFRSATTASNVTTKRWDFRSGSRPRSSIAPFRTPRGRPPTSSNTLEHIGVFDAPVARITPLVDPRVPDNSGVADARARSYLHANCAICHRPEGNYSSIDMRYGVPLAKMNVCNVDPNKGDLGVVRIQAAFPGDAGQVGDALAHAGARYEGGPHAAASNLGYGYDRHGRHFRLDQVGHHMSLEEYSNLPTTIVRGES